MEFSESFLFCRVCLVPEEEGSQKFDSIFSNNGQIAQKLHKISGISPIDVDERVPSLICKSCTKEVSDADLLRKRILDATDQIIMMTAEREMEVFARELQELKRNNKVKDKNENEENVLKKFDNSSKFYVSKVFLRKRDYDKKIIEYFKQNPLSINESLEQTKKLSSVIAKVFQPEINKTSEKTSNGPEKKTTNVVKTSKDNMNYEPQSDKLPKKNPIKQEVQEIAGVIKKEKENLQKSQPKKKKKKVPTSFECDTCKECFYSTCELDNHVATHHKCKLEIFFC